MPRYLHSHHRSPSLRLCLQTGPSLLIHLPALSLAPWSVLQAVSALPSGTARWWYSASENAPVAPHCNEKSLEGGLTSNWGALHPASPVSCLSHSAHPHRSAWWRCPLFPPGLCVVSCPASLRLSREAFPTTLVPPLFSPPSLFLPSPCLSVLFVELIVFSLKLCDWLLISVCLCATSWLSLPEYKLPKDRLSYST